MISANEPAAKAQVDVTRPRVRAAVYLFLLVLAAGAGLRIWYASGELHMSRFEDERYSLRNVRSYLDTGSLKPSSAYYPSPVFNLPQALALEQDLDHRKGDREIQAPEQRDQTAESH